MLTNTIYTAHLQPCHWLSHKTGTFDKGHLRVLVVGPSPQSVYITQGWALLSCLRWVSLAWNVFKKTVTRLLPPTHCLAGP